MKTLLPERRETRNLWDVAGEMDRLLDSPFELLPRMAVQEGLWHPTMDIYNRPHELVVEFELPGIKMEELEVRVEDNHLILEGTRKRTKDYKEDDRYYTERLVGAFHRVVHLPCEVDADRVEAHFTEGLLVLRLPKVKRVEGRGKKIEIQAQ